MIIAADPIADCHSVELVACIQSNNLSKCFYCITDGNASEQLNKNLQINWFRDSSDTTRCLHKEGIDKSQSINQNVVCYQLSTISYCPNKALAITVLFVSDRLQCEERRDVQAQCDVGKFLRLRL